MLELGKKWRATFMEAWNPALWDVTLPAVEVSLSQRDRRIIGSATPEFAQVFGLPGRMPDRLECEPQIRDAIGDLSETGAFVRLGSASFKRESALSMPLETFEQCIDMIRALNPRAARFIGDSLENEYPLSLFVFPWHPIQDWAEFRMFVRNGRLAGVSKYHCDTRFEELQTLLPDISAKIDAFWERVSLSSHGATLGLGQSLLKSLTRRVLNCQTRFL
jgi:hypothetical protein